MFKIDRKVPLVGVVDVESLESKLGCKFPDDYKKFLVETNGGGPADESSFFVLDSGRELCVDYFYSVIEPDCSSYEILNQVALFTGRIPVDCIPIGSDPFGNQILMGVDFLGNIGEIYFWDHDREGFDKPVDMYHNVDFMAESFSGFLESLGPRLA